MSKCYTVGYLSPISGEVVLFEKPKVSSRKVSRGIKALTSRDQRVLDRKINGEWDEIDDFLYPELNQ